MPKPFAGKPTGSALLLASVLCLATGGLANSLGCTRPARQNLVIITIDTTRADHLGCYGYEGPTSPNMDRFAEDATLFERCYSQTPITLPAHTSIFSGTFPISHGVRDNGAYVVPERVQTLAEVLGDQGYDTAAFVSAFVLDSRYGLDQGFQVYDDDYSGEWSEENLRDAWIYTQMVIDRRADQTTRRAVGWLQDRKKGPFFLWVHYYDPHQRYDPPHPYNQLFQYNLYDGEIAFMDTQIDELLGAIRSEGLWDQTAVVVTGDHGEGFGQHGETTHAVLTYDSTLHVPLIIKPGAKSSIPPARVTSPVSHVDIVPTVCELLEVTPPSTVHGRSLVSVMKGGDIADEPSYFESCLPRLSFGWAPLFGVRSGEWKYLHSPEIELYDLEEDPEELYNLAASEPGRRKEMESLLFSIVDREVAQMQDAGDQQPMDPEARARLAALGYVVSSAGVTGDDLNPRDQSGRRSPNVGAPYLADYYLANGLASRGRIAEAAMIFESTLLPLDPENPAFLTSLANLKRRLGRPDEAFALLKRAQALVPDDASILVQLGQLEIDRGHVEAAGSLFASALDLEPKNLTAAHLWARTASLLGRRNDAIDRYLRVLEIDSSHRSTLIALGVELAREGRVDEGREHLRQALSVSPFSARAFYNLGLLELVADNPEQACQAFEMALRYRRPYVEARLGLGAALLDAGDAKRGIAELNLVIEVAPSGTAADKARSLLQQHQPGSGESDGSGIEIDSG